MTPAERKEEENRKCAPSGRPSRNPTWPTREFREDRKEKRNCGNTCAPVTLSWRLDYLHGRHRCVDDEPEEHRPNPPDACVGGQRKEGPEHRKEGPEHRKEGPEHRKEGPEHRKEGPEHRKEGPEHRKEGPEHRPATDESTCCTDCRRRGRAPEDATEGEEGSGRRDARNAASTPQAGTLA
jgi:hypothetical protein